MSNRDLRVGFRYSRRSTLSSLHLLPISMRSIGTRECPMSNRTVIIWDGRPVPASLRPVVLRALRPHHNSVPPPRTGLPARDTLLAKTAHLSQFSFRSCTMFQILVFSRTHESSDC